MQHENFPAIATDPLGLPEGAARLTARAAAMQVAQAQAAQAKEFSS
ncbi:MAG: hypothetical protein JJU21_16880 [Salinarimonas sp.]|nr:hypothetical protein [Salinarimonas sp.]